MSHATVICKPDQAGRTPGGIIPGASPDPFLVPPPNADFFDRFSSQSIGPTVQDVLLADLLLFADERAVITGIGMEILDDPPGTAVDGFSNVVWSLTFNETKQRDFGTIVDQIGRGDQLSPVRIKIDLPGAKIRFRASNNDAVDTFLCFGRFQGYSFK